MRRLVLLCMLAACGDGAHGPPDASVVPDDADTELVSIAMTGWLTNAGHSVIFQNADSTIVSITTTDASGHANARMKPGGFVTVVDESLEGSRTIMTRAAVMGGRTIAMDVQPIPHTHNVLLTVKPHPSATANTPYVLDAPCEHIAVTEAATQQQFYDLSGCPDVTDLLITAFPPTGEASIGVSSVDLGRGSAVTVNAVGTYVAPSDVNVLVHGPVENAADNGLLVSHGLIAQGAVQWGLSLEDPPSPHTVHIPVVDGLTAKTVILSTGSGHGVIDWAPVAPTVDIDYASLAFAPQTSLARYSVDDSLAGRGAPTIAWDEGAGAHGELIAGTILWSVGGLTTSWSVMGPRGETPVLALPRLTAVPTSAPVSLNLYEVHAENGALGALDDVLSVWDPTVEWRVLGARGRVVWRYLGYQL